MSSFDASIQISEPQLPLKTKCPECKIIDTLIWFSENRNKNNVTAEEDNSLPLQFTRYCDLYTSLQTAVFYHYANKRFSVMVCRMLQATLTSSEVCRPEISPLLKHCLVEQLLFKIITLISLTTVV